MNRLVSLMLVALSFASNAMALPLSRPHLQIDLQSELIAVAPGSQATLGLFVQPESGWHVYWKNPGDTGAEPKFHWDLSDGLKVTAIHWPTPERIALGSLVNFGYSSPRWILFDVAIGKSQKPGEIARADLDFDWLVCNEECIPGNGQFRVELSIAERELVNNSLVTVFDDARRRIPQLGSPSLVHARANDSSVWLDFDRHPGISQAQFFPWERGQIRPSAVQQFKDHQLKLEREKGRAIPNRLSGILLVTSDAGEQAFEVAPTVNLIDPRAENKGSGSENLSLQDIDQMSAATQGEISNIFLAIIFAFIGGLILNFMPCVLPVLSIKVFELLEARKHSTAAHGGANSQIRRDALIFSSGVIFSMLTLASLLIVFRQSAVSIGWGFQLQYPPFVAFMCLLVFALGLGFLGALELPVPRWAANIKGGGPFFSGVLATLLATPCTAPFMGAGLAYALTRPVNEALAVFFALGLGMSAPYLLVALIPATSRFLPRPGAWMETLKQLLSFPLFATAIWLVWVLGRQVGVNAVVGVLIAALCIALAAWMYAKNRSIIYAPFRWILNSVAACAFLLSVVSVLTFARKTSTERTVHPVEWVPYRETALQEVINSGKPVFVDFTADWCITCKVNENLVLSLPSVRDSFLKKNFVLMKGDWTDGNDEITRALERHGRDGVPLYVFYRKRAEGIVTKVLPTVLTPGMVLEEIERFSS